MSKQRRFPAERFVQQEMFCGRYLPFLTAHIAVDAANRKDIGYFIKISWTSAVPQGDYGPQLFIVSNQNKSGCQLTHSQNLD